MTAYGMLATKASVKADIHVCMVGLSKIPSHGLGVPHCLLLKLHVEV